MNISCQKVVSVIYELTTSGCKGAIVEKVTVENPLIFISGTGNLLEAFEQQLQGLATGDSFNFKIPCHDAYGLPNEKAVIDLPVDAFIIEGKLDEELVQIGNIVPMRDQEGNRLNGKIISVTQSAIKMDFNHPLAGDDLHFSGTVVGIRDATPEELSHGHVHDYSTCEDCRDESDCNGNCQ